MHTLLGNYGCYISLHIRDLEVSLFITNLKLAFFEDDLDNLVLGLVRKELIQIGLLRNRTVVGILEYLVALQHLPNVLF